jgi:predicted Fe-S protein YdhL (DUF1289 family)
MMDNGSNVESPCVRNCCLDQNDICLGCFRTISEIIAWSESSQNQRTKILSNAKKRNRKNIE